MKKIVYISGPFTKPDPVANTNRAMGVWDRLWESGVVVPICPHWSLIQHLHTPRPWEEWLEYDLALIERCDAVLRIPGESRGADKEVDHSIALRKPVLYSVEEAIRWARGEVVV